MQLTYIKIPLYRLNYVSDLNEISLDQEFLDEFRDEYETEERKNIFEQLEWGVKNPDYNFKSLVTSDKFTNKEIYSYIEKLHKFMVANKAF